LANEQNLRAPWKPGETGNRRGSSRKQRAKSLLRDFIHDRLGAEIPEDLREQLEETVRGLRAGEAIADGIVRSALLGDKRSVDQILSTEPKLLEVAGELDLRGDPEEAEVSDSLAAIAKRRRTNGSGRSVDAPTTEGPGS